VSYKNLMFKEKVLIFDQDGTLYPRRSRLGRRLSEVTKTWLCERLNLRPEDFSAFKQVYPNFVDAIYANRMSLSEWHSEVLSGLAAETEGLIETDHNLASIMVSLKAKLHLVSFSSVEFSLAVVGALGLEGVFTSISNVNLPDKKNVYRKIMAGENTIPADIRVFGDNYKFDLLPAQEMGMSVTCIDDEYKSVFDYIISKQDER